MSERVGRVDGFQLASGLLSVAAGPVLLLRGAPAGWSFLLIAAGLILVAAQSVIVNDITFEITDRIQIIMAVAGLVSIGIAVVYLTRAANDLPSLFPGHDGDSEHFRIVPGVVTLTVGLVAVGRSLASVRFAPAQG